MPSIRYCHDSILDSDAPLIVCPVNAVGVMGAGLALAIKRRWPEVVQPYRDLCEASQFGPGQVMRVEIEDGQRHVAMLSTKDRWSDPSKMRWVCAGILGLVHLIRAHHIERVAVPALGCGLGQLRWDQVRALVEVGSKSTPECAWDVYPPGAR